MIVLGIDPGQSGGLAAIKDSDIIEAMLMPVIDISPLAKKSKLVLDAPLISMWFKCIAPSYIGLEDVHAMPRQGVSSMFQFGRSFGAIEALARVQQSVANSVYYISPQTWKNYFGLIKADKDDSREVATEIFGTDEYWYTKSRNGVAEAALIAYYLKDNVNA